MEFSSRIAGKDAIVAINPDRIEWSGPGVRVETPARTIIAAIPIRGVQRVATRPLGFGRTMMTIATAETVIELHMPNYQAEEAKDLLLHLRHQLVGSVA